MLPPTVAIASPPATALFDGKVRNEVLHTFPAYILGFVRIPDKTRRKRELAIELVLLL
jgi:hypothetical protein